jgi:hypothetical protein
MTASTGVSVPRHRVRVWLGATVISDLVVSEEAADRHAVAMQRRFACLRVTNEPVVAPDDEQS